MRKLVVPVALAASSLISGLASAQQAPAPSPVTGNITLASEYRFRGIDQTAGKPAIQGGLDYSHASGVYLGNWNSNISQGAGFPGGSLEMDFYGGWKKAFGDLGLDVGAIYYYYPGTDAGNPAALALANPHTSKTNSGTVHNTEFYIGGSWKWLSLKWFHALSDYFSIPDTSGTNYFDFAATYDLGGGLGLVGHIGKLKAHGYSELDYTDYKLGVTKDITGWVLGAAYVGSNAKGNCPFNATTSPYCFSNPSGQSPRDAGRSTIVLSVGKTF
jgi:uncharacterized protein (TIGR02001 family)